MGQTTGKSMQRHSFTPRETCLKSTLNPTGTARSHENTPPQEQRKRAANCAKKITPIIFINKPRRETTPPPPLTSKSPGKRAMIAAEVLSRFVLFQERLNTSSFCFSLFRPFVLLSRGAALFTPSVTTRRVVAMERLTQ